MASGDYHLNSDIDILVVSHKLEETQKKLSKVASDLTTRYLVPVIIIVVSLEDWKKEKTRLIKVVRQEGKSIWIRRQR